jgi:hypothetical protein
MPNEIPAKPKRVSKKQDANVFLSVWDIHIILRELEIYEKQIAKLTGRTEPAGPMYAAERRRLRALIERLYAVHGGWLRVRRAGRPRAGRK